VAELDSQRAAEALIEWWALSGVDVTEARALMRTPGPQAARTAEAPPSAPAPRAPAPKPAARSAAAPRQGVTEALAAAGAARSLAELKSAIESFEGCDLKKTARNTVFSDGVESAEIMLVGEAPGRDEDEQGKPFVGRSGQLLDRMFESIGYSRQSNLFISNVIFWRPPGNREPTPGEIGPCMPFIERAIALKAPKIVVFIGGVSAKAMLATDQGVMRLRGRRLTYKPSIGPSVNAMVMLHPAYLLRRPQEKRLAWQDLLMLEDWAKELGVTGGQRL
jgi:DNA polymerase